MTQSQPTQQPKKRSFATALQRSFMDLHIFFYRQTGGAIGGKSGSRLMLLLTTTGRKSGKERITPIQYTSDGERYILIGSNGGAAKHPLWWLNLQANPQARVQVGRDNVAVTATQAQGEERLRLWTAVITKYPNFAGYQKWTKREIPVVILTPQ